MSYRAYYVDPEGALKVGLDEEAIRQAYLLRQGLLWVDIVETTEEDGQFLSRAFGFHPLSIEDCVSPQVHAPKVDDFREHLFLVVHAINHALESETVETTELNLFLGSHFVVSNHNFPLYSVAGVQAQVDQDGRPMRRGADFLVHALLDALTDNTLPTLHRMDEFADGVEEKAIRRPDQGTLEAILKLKRSTTQLHRVMEPQRELLNRLSRGEFALIRPEALIFYRDVYDHVVRIEDLNRSLRERADYALAMHMSAVAHRQNETMKLLAIVASIFLPMTLVAGIYGMNFENMPELRWPWGYYWALGLMAAIAGAAAGLLWARSWLMWGRRQVSRLHPFTVEPERLIGYVGREIGQVGGQIARWTGL